MSKRCKEFILSFFVTECFGISSDEHGQIRGIKSVAAWGPTAVFCTKRREAYATPRVVSFSSYFLPTFQRSTAWLQVTSSLTASLLERTEEKRPFVTQSFTT
ncbi:hypothetical protein J6590_013912 [Homalodisca vitripennis]|nr:hypothetical protein J6590_013912 [Homalodisca vitripennis]